MLRVFLILILNVIFFLIPISILNASSKAEIINNINSLNTLKFNFTQKSFDKEEKGICYLKRPHYLKCFYEDKNQKELIISKRILVIYHKRYNKIYRYPLSKSFFLEILNREKFARIIREGDLNQENNVLEIKYIDQDKGEIDFYFSNKNYDLIGWRVIDINNNITILKINNQSKNIEIKQKIFFIPEVNQ